jgi:[ribosomal protein S5]-alanine N-acetyltransferase
MYALEAGDEELFCELFTDKETMQFVGATLSTKDAARSFGLALRAQTRRPVNQVFLRAVDERSGQKVGLCSIQDIDRDERRAELGVILKPARHAQGLGKEALGALVSYAFSLFPIDEAWVQYDAQHLAAERLVISTGFAHAREYADRGCTKRIWSAFRQEWSPRIVANA